ncbi:hypothetical protein M8C13_32255 [Crossiella sp. SN42]|uniref:hypothetical protein n=1 Tax=Crossiella sp. SN42 TaxID=2944808 RepID=UPI00207C830C|nr:hypothetical protein [Crossiella sp. SN42]MCO1580438.1 hypothetical protein [Crossiella sp. SN42]
MATRSAATQRILRAPAITDKAAEDGLVTAINVGPGMFGSSAVITISSRPAWRLVCRPSGTMKSRA